MGLFEKTKIDEKPGNVLYNLDGVAYGTFNAFGILDDLFLDFDEAQKQFLTEIVGCCYAQHVYEYEWVLPYLGYPKLPAEYMRMILDCHEAGMCVCYDPLNTWKIIHSNLTLSQFRYALTLTTQDVYIVDEIGDLSQYEDRVFDLLLQAAECGVNLCKYVKPDMNMVDFEERVRKAKRKHRFSIKVYDILFKESKLFNALSSLASW